MICRVKSKQKIFVFKEQRSKLIINNNKRIEATVITVDGCEITNGLRCDYLLCARGIEYYIELKGQDLDHAINQLKATINSLSADNKNQPKVCYIICTRSPLSSASIQSLQYSFMKEFKSKLVIKSSPYEDSI